MQHHKHSRTMNEISLLLDSYEDIFSDFDPRPYAQKALSDDFLAESKRASRDKVSGEIELRFRMPKKRRHTRTEETIKKRLKAHFKRHYEMLQKEKKETIKTGGSFATAGVIVMLIATLIHTYVQEKSFVMSFLILLLEPAGWFLLWEGLNTMIFESKKNKPDLEFYDKMSRSKIYFMNC